MEVIRRLFGRTSPQYDELPKLEADNPVPDEKHSQVLIKEVSTYNDLMETEDYLNQGNIVLVEITSTDGLQNPENKLEEVADRVSGDIALYNDTGYYILTPPSVGLKKERL